MVSRPSAKPSGASAVDVAKKSKRRSRRKLPPPPKMRRLSASERAAFQAFVFDAKGDPRLSAWEANFVNSLGYFLDTPTWFLLSEKRRQKIAEIADKIVFGPIDAVAKEADAECGRSLGVVLTNRYGRSFNEMGIPVFADESDHGDTMEDWV